MKIDVGGKLRAEVKIGQAAEVDGNRPDCVGNSYIGLLTLLEAQRKLNFRKPSLAVRHSTG
jgi:hypothetical protein